MISYLKAGVQIPKPQVQTTKYEGAFDSAESATSPGPGQAKPESQLQPGNPRRVCACVCLVLEGTFPQGARPLSGFPKSARAEPACAKQKATRLGEQHHEVPEWLRFSPVPFYTTTPKRSPPMCMSSPEVETLQMTSAS